MADDLFTERYGDLLTGSYDCVDRIVLNAYYPLGSNPAGMRHWWRRLHGGSDEQLDDTHLMRMAGRFARRVKAWGQADVPVIFCKKGVTASTGSRRRTWPSIQLHRACSWCWSPRRRRRCGR